MRAEIDVGGSFADVVMVDEKKGPFASLDRSANPSEVGGEKL